MDGLEGLGIMINTTCVKSCLKIDRTFCHASAALALKYKSIGVNTVACRSEVHSGHRVLSKLLLLSAAMMSIVCVA